MATKQELEDRLRNVEDKVNIPPVFDRAAHKDKTRSQIALFVVRAYFGLLFLVLIGTPIYNLYAPPALVVDVKDLIGVVSGAASGILGFVVGYYFKGSERE